MTRLFLCGPLSADVPGLAWRLGLVPGLAGGQVAVLAGYGVRACAGAAVGHAVWQHAHGAQRHGRVGCVRRVLLACRWRGTVAGLREIVHAVAAIFARRDIFGILACCGDRVGDALATDAFVHGAAEIDWVAKNEVVVLDKQVSKYVSKFRAHDADGAVTMGLEKGDDAPGKGLQRRKRCGNLVGVMAKIIDDHDVIGSANNIKAAGKTAEAFHAADGLL